MISVRQYWQGREITHAAELTPNIRGASVNTTLKAGRLLKAYSEATGDNERRVVRWGWRPPSLNMATVGAAADSLHMEGKAIDLADGQRTLARWCVSNLETLEAIGLWMEDPRWTPTWVHLQTEPPVSGKRVFIPKAERPTDMTFPVTW